MRAAVLRDGRMGCRDDVAPLITAEVGLSEVSAAFDDLTSPDEHYKILVTP
jgi:hypothetical protein